MTLLNTLKSLLLIWPFLLCHFFFQRQCILFSCQFSLFWGQLHVCGHKLKAKGALKNSVVSGTFFSLFVLDFCQEPISMMDFGILLTSMPEDIALRWRWITMLPLLAMQPQSPGSTLGTATILEVSCFAQMQDTFLWSRSLGAHHWGLPSCTLFAAKRKFVVTDFRYLLSFSVYSAVGRSKHLD